MAYSYESKKGSICYLHLKYIAILCQLFLIHCLSIQAIVNPYKSSLIYLQVIAAARLLPILNIYLIFCPDDFDRMECFDAPLQSYASNCLLIILLLHVQATRTSYRFSFKPGLASNHGNHLYLPFLYHFCHY